MSNFKEGLFNSLGATVVRKVRKDINSRQGHKFVPFIKKKGRKSRDRKWDDRRLWFLISVLRNCLLEVSGSSKESVELQG